jgi:hypothetical protein
MCALYLQSISVALYLQSITVALYLQSLGGGLFTVRMIIAFGSRPGFAHLSVWKEQPVGEGNSGPDREVGGRVPLVLVLARTEPGTSR